MYKLLSGKAKKQSDGLKISNTSEEEKDSQMLDASFLDVYKGAHAVIFVFDITKKWTYQYVERELPKVTTLKCVPKYFFIILNPLFANLYIFIKNDIFLNKYLDCSAFSNI